MGGIGPARLLESDLLPHYAAMAQHLGAGSENYNRLYAQRLAEVALFSGTNPMEHGWLDQFTAAASGEGRVEWIRCVSSALSRLSSSDVDAKWDSWMLDYWHNRLESKPRALTDEEATALDREPRKPVPRSGGTCLRAQAIDCKALNGDYQAVPPQRSAGAD